MRPKNHAELFEEVRYLRERNSELLDVLSRIDSMAFSAGVDEGYIVLQNVRELVCASMGKAA